MNIIRPVHTIAALLIAMVASTDTAIAAEDDKADQPSAVGANSGWSAQVATDGGSGITLGPQQTAIVGKISKYFADLTTLNGRFVQTGADKKVMKGKFKILRPGMFRFDYARPSLQVIISDGQYLAIQDHDLGNEDRIALDQTPFRLLLRKDVNLMRDARIIEIQETDQTIFVALQDKNPDSPGLIKLTFKKTPKIELAEWITTDVQGLDTHVSVKNLEYGKKLDAKEFEIRAPERSFLP